MIGRYSGRREKWVWREIVDAIPAPIAVADSCGCIVAANAAFRITFGPCDYCVCPGEDRLILNGVCFDCHRLDEVGHVALVGKAG